MTARRGDNCPTCGKYRAFGTSSGGDSATVMTAMKCEDGHEWNVTYKLNRKTGEYDVVRVEKAVGRSDGVIEW